MPITTFLYRCDSSFYLEPLMDMLLEREIYGLFLIDRRECTIGLLKGSLTNYKRSFWIIILLKV